MNQEQPCTDNGVQFVQERIAPSGPTSCSGVPDGSTVPATKPKTRDQFVVAMPEWFPQAAWDIVVLLTPYYVQQLVVIAFPSVQSASVVRQYARYLMNSIPTKTWWDNQLPYWHNPADYTIYDDTGAVVTSPIEFAIGWHCPVLLRSLFTDMSADADLLRLVREMRRWGRYVTINPIANATEYKGRVASAQIQFNSALNNTVSPATAGVPGPEPLPGPINTPAGFTSLNLSVQHSTSTERTYLYDGFRWHNLPLIGLNSVATVPVTYSFPIYNGTGTAVVIPEGGISTLVAARTSSGFANIQLIFTDTTVASTIGTTTYVFNQALRTRDTARLGIVMSDELARYSITPDFTYEALLQADTKAYSNNWVEGATSRQGSGKNRYDYTSTREYRPLVRAPPTVGAIAQDSIATKRDLVDLSGRWHIDYVTNADPKASIFIAYGTHYQWCAETNSPFMLFQRDAVQKDVGALELADTLDSILPHTYPANFNDGGILPKIMSRIKKVGSAGLGGMARSIVSELMGGLKYIGTQDRLIGYPNYSTTYGNNSVNMIEYNGNGNGNGRNGRKKKNGNGNGPSLFAHLV